jgi:DNA-binding protein HU-beta
MARKGNTDLFSALRSQGLRKRVARALSDIESGGRDARGNAEKLGRRVIADLRTAADTIEKRLDLGGAGTRSTAAKKGARTRKRSATKRSSAAKKGAAKRARKGTKSTTSRAAGVARKATGGARKAASGARKSTGRKTTARKSTARKRSSKRS